MAPIDLLIFDNDGTLVNTERLDSIALAEELAVRNVAVAPEVLTDDYRGMQLAAAVADLERKYDFDAGDSFISGYRQRLRQLIRRSAEPMAGVVPALRQLGQPRCVASNASAAKVRLCLEVTGLAPFFNDHVFSAYDIEAWKPAPDLFEHAAKMMNHTAGQTLVVEDSIVGIKAAAAAGMRSVLFDPDGRYPANEATVTIADMHLLPDAIQQLAAS